MYDQQVLPDSGATWCSNLDARVNNGQNLAAGQETTVSYPVKTEPEEWYLHAGNTQLDWR